MLRFRDRKVTLRTDSHGPIKQDIRDVREVRDHILNRISAIVDDHPL